MSGAGGSEQATLASSRARRGGSGRSYEQETLRGDFRVPWDHQQDCALLGMVRLRGSNWQRMAASYGGTMRSAEAVRARHAHLMLLPAATREQMASAYLEQRRAQQMGSEHGPVLTEQDSRLARMACVAAEEPCRWEQTSEEGIGLLGTIPEEEVGVVASDVGAAGAAADGRSGYAGRSWARACDERLRSGGIEAVLEQPLSSSSAARLARALQLHDRQVYDEDWLLVNLSVAEETLRGAVAAERAARGLRALEPGDMGREVRGRRWGQGTRGIIVYTPRDTMASVCASDFHSWWLGGQKAGLGGFLRVQVVARWMGIPTMSPPFSVAAARLPPYLLWSATADSIHVSQARTLVRWALKNYNLRLRPRVWSYMGMWSGGMDAFYRAVQEVAGDCVYSMAVEQDERRRHVVVDSFKATSSCEDARQLPEGRPPVNFVGLSPGCLLHSSKKRTSNGKGRAESVEDMRAASVSDARRMGEAVAAMCRKQAPEICLFENTAGMVTHYSLGLAELLRILGRLPYAWWFRVLAADLDVKSGMRRRRLGGVGVRLDCLKQPVPSCAVGWGAILIEQGRMAPSCPLCGAVAGGDDVGGMFCPRLGCDGMKAAFWVGGAAVAATEIE